MDKLFNFLSDYLPVAAWLFFIIFAVYAIVELYNNSKTVKEIFCVIKDKIIRLATFFKRRARKKLNAVLMSREYLDWQNKLLRKIYEPVIAEYNKSHKIKCGFVDLTLKNTYSYEAVYFKAPAECEYAFPFTQLYSKSETVYNEFYDGNNKPATEKYLVLPQKFRKTAKKYYSIVSSSISFPYNVGYMLEDIDVDGINGAKFHFKTQTNVYKNNVYSSHILEYELYKLYVDKYKKGKMQLENESAQSLLSQLPVRKALHDNFADDPQKILSSGKGRNSLLSVSMMVACKNPVNGSHDFLRICRSKNVDAKVGFYQFIPSGGFSTLTPSLDFETQYSDFSLSKAVLREFLEECFGQEDFAGRSNISTESIYANDIIAQVFKDIDDENNETQMCFLGTSVSLVSLRHELCFLMVLDNQELVKKIKENEECNNVINFVAKDVLENEDFWNHYNRNVNPQDSELLKLNSTSAGLWKLAQMSDKYKNL